MSEELRKSCSIDGVNTATHRHLLNTVMEPLGGFIKVTYTPLLPGEEAPCKVVAQSTIRDL